MRGGGVITVVPRLAVGLGSRWDDTSIIIPPGRWRNQLGDEVYEGGQVALTKLTAQFPVCLLVREEAKQ
jgi:(1->4)-alpha-D-glucan 1-alpha-D-glucosylmutase